jgi:ParB family chromosome partitioning protein
MKIKNIKIDDVFVKKQIRTVFNPETIKSLADSIREKGVLQPILVKKIGDEYKVVAGERRYLASQEAGLKEIPACILEDTDNDKEIQLIENTQREDLNPLDLSNAFKDLRDSGKTLDEIASLAGRTKQHVIEMLSLLELPDEDKEKIKNGEAYTKFTRPKLQKKEENSNNNDDLNDKSMTENKVNSVYLTDSNTFDKNTEQNQEVNEENITISNSGIFSEEPKAEDQEPEGLGFSENPNIEYQEPEEDQKPKTPAPVQKTEDQKPKADLKSFKVEPEEVLNTEADYPVYSGMPKEELEEGEEPVEVSPESFVDEEGNMIDLQNRPVYETEEGYAVIIEPKDVKELIEKFNEGSYGFKIQLGEKDSLILLGIDGSKNIYNVINCLINNVKDYIDV